MLSPVLSITYAVKNLVVSSISTAFVIAGVLAAGAPTLDSVGLVAFGGAGLIFVAWKLIGENRAQKEIREGFMEVIDEKDETIASKNTEIELLKSETSQLNNVPGHNG